MEMIFKVLDCHLILFHKHLNCNAFFDKNVYINWKVLLDGNTTTLIVKI